MSAQNNLPTNPTTPLPPTPPVPPAPPAPPAPQQAYPVQQPVSPYPQYDATVAPSTEEGKAGAFYDTMKKAGAKAKAMGAEQADRLKEANAQRKLQASLDNQGLESAGFFKALFDLSFHNFITVKFAKLIYLIWILGIALSIVIAAISVLGLYISEDSGGIGFIMALVVLVVGSIAGLIQLILVRLGIEIAVSLIRTAENTSHLRRQQAETNNLLHQNQ